MKWQQQQVSLYSTHGDRAGRVVAVGEVLLSRFADNMTEIVALRNLDHGAPDYTQTKREFKSHLHCFAPSAVLTDRIEVVSMSGLLQLDFDSADCEGFDIEELKQAVFSLPFVAFVSLSCSGSGFYALAAIAEPERQREYAAHIFDVLATYGLSCDRSKGRNYNDLRYVSYDANMLYREDVEPLRITYFKDDKAATKRNESINATTSYNGNTALIASWVNYIEHAQVGQRWETVQKVAYFLGGKSAGLEDIEAAIISNPAFAGEEKKYIKCASDCFAAGQRKPLK